MVKPTAYGPGFAYGAESADAIEVVVFVPLELGFDELQPAAIARTEMAATIERLHALRVVTGGVSPRGTPAV